MKKIVLIMLASFFTIIGIGHAETLFSSDPDAIEKAAESVLMLEVFDSDNELIATGSGFVIYNNRTIVTNYHVIEDADWILANSDAGYQYMITKVLVADEDKDIAICSFMSPTDLQPLEINLDGEQKRAEGIVAIGSPKGIMNTVSLGNISALYEDNGVSWIQFTAPISSGSSGGALFDDTGRVIGVTSASYIDAQNINLAVHISEVAELYDSWDGVEEYFDDYFAELYNDPYLATTENPSPSPDTTSPPKPTVTPRPTYTPSPQPRTTEYPMLSKGDTGEAVKKLQQALIELGYLDGTADGIYGKMTAEAVELFNEQIGWFGPWATDYTQQCLYGPNPPQYRDPDMALYIKDGAYAEWENQSGNKLRIHFQVTNKARKKTVKAFELYIYATDVWGDRVYGTTYYYGTTTKIVSPGETVYSDYFSIPDRSEINCVYCGIHKVAYTDGTSYTMPEHLIEYICWDIK